MMKPEVQILFVAVSCLFCFPADPSPVCDVLLYNHDGECTETCPEQHFGNYSSQECQPFPADYTVLFNATAYYANVSADTPLNTSILHFQVVINNTYFMNQQLQVELSLIKNAQVEGFFKFENGETQESLTGDWPVEIYPSIVLNRSVIYASAPEGLVLPADFDFALSVIVFSGVGIHSSPESHGFVTVTEAVNDCDGVDCFNGTCQDGNLDFDCTCDPGYTGTYCNTDINECAEIDCYNGECIDLVNNFTCACSEGWEGKYCNTSIDYCEGVNCFNGTCQNGNFNFACICDPGYTGTYCNMDINECADVECHNGECIDLVNNFTCACSEGWEGKYCNTSIDYCAIDPCNSTGTARCDNSNSTYTCVCYSGWKGQHCEVDVDYCEPNPCSPGGTAQCEDGNTTYTCVCNLGYIGQNCSDVVDICMPNSCSNGGTCNAGSGSAMLCMCPPEYTGAMCEVLVHSPSCAPDYCMNNGTCLEQEGSGVMEPLWCLCPPEYTGLMCDIRVDSTPDTSTSLIIEPTPGMKVPSSDEVTFSGLVLYGTAGVGGLVLLSVVAVLTVAGCAYCAKRRRRRAAYLKSLDFSAFSVDDPVATELSPEDTRTNGKSLNPTSLSQQTSRTSGIEMQGWEKNPYQHSRSHGNGYTESSLMFPNPGAELSQTSLA